MTGFLLVFAGGGFGAAMRYGLSLMLPCATGGWPWSTMLANIAGSLVMGILAGCLSTRGSGGEEWRLFLGVGILGGFTTFSAFSLEAVTMVERGALGDAALYAIGSVILSILALWGGLSVARTVFI